MRTVLRLVYGGGCIVCVTHGHHTRKLAVGKGCCMVGVGGSSALICWTENRHVLCPIVIVQQVWLLLHLVLTFRARVSAEKISGIYVEVARSRTFWMEHHRW